MIPLTKPLFLLPIGSTESGKNTTQAIVIIGQVVGGSSSTAKGKDILDKNRRYPRSGYILGVLTHTTALDRHCGGDETLK